jgi:tetratricopeptide (TPR) repeat protein
LRFADKLESLRPGEFIAVGRDGRALGRSEIRARRTFLLTALGTACAAAILINPFVGLIYTGMLGGWVALSFRRAGIINRMLRLIRAERYDDAEREIASLDRRGGLYHSVAWQGRMLIACQRGRLEEACAAAEACERLTSPRRRAHVYWSAQFVRASVLFELGRVDEARAVLDKAMKAPDGELFVIIKREQECLLAFVTDRPDGLGTDDQLHERVRTALRYNHTGMTVALLAWAYERRGDAEMCEHLVGEVESRCVHGPALIERMHPRVWAWLGPKLDAARAKAAAEA